MTLATVLWILSATLFTITGSMWFSSGDGVGVVFGILCFLVSVLCILSAVNPV